MLLFNYPPHFRILCYCTYLYIIYDNNIVTVYNLYWHKLSKWILNVFRALLPHTYIVLNVYFLWVLPRIKYYFYRKNQINMIYGHFYIVNFKMNFSKDRHTILKYDVSQYNIKYIFRAIFTTQLLPTKQVVRMGIN